MVLSLLTPLSQAVPVGEYVSLIPSAWSAAGIHFETSGKTKVEPVPVSEPAVGFADAGCVLPAKAASATTASTTRPAARMRFMILIPLSLRFMSTACPKTTCAASLLRTVGVVWCTKVKIS